MVVIEAITRTVEALTRAGIAHSIDGVKLADVERAAEVAAKTAQAAYYDSDAENRPVRRAAYYAADALHRACLNDKYYKVATGYYAKVYMDNKARQLELAVWMAENAHLG